MDYREDEEHSRKAYCTHCEKYQDVWFSRKMTLDEYLKQNNDCPECGKKALIKHYGGRGIVV